MINVELRRACKVTHINLSHLETDRFFFYARSVFAFGAASPNCFSSQWKQNIFFECSMTHASNKASAGGFAVSSKPIEKSATGNMVDKWPESQHDDCVPETNAGAHISTFQPSCRLLTEDNPPTGRRALGAEGGGWTTRLLLRDKKMDGGAHFVRADAI